VTTGPQRGAGKERKEPDMARPIAIEQLVESLGEASPLARERLSAVLTSSAGVTQVQEAAAALGISSQRFHILRERILSGALSAAEPRPAGRPANEEDPEIAALRNEVSELKRKLADQKIYAEIDRLRDAMLAAGMGRKLKRLQKKRR
jgi:hypothetical protein